MPVGKGSIARAVKSQNKEAVIPAASEEKMTEKKEAAVKETAEPKKAGRKTAEKSEKKTAARKPASKKTTAEKKTDIHEEKFQVVSHIQCELPVHLL